MKNAQKKDKCRDSKLILEKVAKKPKITPTSKPTPISIEVESQNQDENVSNPSSNVFETGATTMKNL
jgi:hypothetical protein